MKVTLITTVLNEADSILQFLESIESQTRKPDEVVIVDGGSTDRTIRIISNFKFKISNFKLIKKRGNRSVGRNAGIKLASNSIIAVTDAGCILESHWLERIARPFSNSKVDVVAGYYKGKAETVFQKCVIPYALVMLDQVRSNSFLPATRSMAFKKSVWEKIGGFNEKLSHNEDYAFAKSLQKINANIVFEKSAIVYWIPRRNLVSFYTMIRRFAYGDAEAGIYRPKVVLIFARYFLGILLVLYIILSKTYYLIPVTYYLLIIYFLWSIWKNYRYVSDVRAFIYLPILQLTSDIAVIVGTTAGVFKSLKKA